MIQCGADVARVVRQSGVDLVRPGGKIVGKCPPVPLEIGRDCVKPADHLLFEAADPSIQRLGNFGRPSAEHLIDFIRLGGKNFGDRCRARGENLVDLAGSHFERVGDFAAAFAENLGDVESPRRQGFIERFGTSVETGIHAHDQPVEKFCHLLHLGRGAVFKELGL